MLGAAEENSWRAEGATQIDSTLGEPKSLRSPSLRHAPMEGKPDRRLTLAARRLDAGGSAHGCRDPERVVGAPRPELVISEGQAVGTG